MLSNNCFLHNIASILKRCSPRALPWPQKSTPRNFGHGYISVLLYILIIYSPESGVALCD